MLVTSIVLLPASAASSLEVVDDRGHPVRLEHAARRIVTLAPHATELLFAIGAGAAVVGTTDYSDFPAAARSVPRVGGFNNLALERIVLASPDLVVAWGGGNPTALLERLRATGVAVFESDPRTLEDVARNMRALGVLAGHVSGAERLASEFETALESLRQRHAGAAPVRVFHQVWGAPLMTVGDQHVVSSVIRLCGGLPVPRGPDRAAWVTSLEAVLAADPQLILSASADSPVGGEGARRAATDLADRPPYWRRYPWVSAVAGVRLHAIDPDLIHRPGPRLVEGAQRTCRLLEAAREALRSTSAAAAAPAAPRAKVRHHGS
jgi:iron complex transport system substrate-binding protein